MKYERIKLGYDFDALEPYIDAKTMEIHYNNHHAGYANKLAEAIETTNTDKWATIDELMINYQSIKDDQVKVKIRQFGGGLWNHNFFFPTLKKDVELQDANLKKALEQKFESIDNFKKEFELAANSLFGSGWVWLVKDQHGSLKIVKTFNQDTPIFLKLIPILGIDVWEHAFYLKHNSNKAQYVSDYWNIINWDLCEERFNN